MKDIYNEIKEYKPFNEEEQRDKEQILKFLNSFDDAFYRENCIGHITASSWIVNKDRTKVLMVYHKLYNSWSWTGGHNDGDENCLNVALKEAKEETGINTLNLLYDGIYSIEVLNVEGHYKRGNYVSSHLHYNITYLLEASEDELLKIKEDENTGVMWIGINDLQNMVSEKWMFEHIYKKLVDKLKYIK